MRHGGDLGTAIALHGGAAEDWLDLSTGINPWAAPMPPAMPARLWQRLPSALDEHALSMAARAAYRVPSAADVVAAPGTQALIQWLPQLAPPGRVAIAELTYSEHARAWQRAGHAVAARSAARHIVIVNPNNPDGCVTSPATLLAAATHVKANGGWLVVDESFADVDPGLGAAVLCAGFPVVVLRSLGKFYGLAGVRLGFAIAAPPIAQTIADALGPWSVSGPALAIGTHVLRDEAGAAAMRERLARGAAALDRSLAADGLDIIGGTSLFRLVRTPHAGALHEHLATRRIWCRRFDAQPELLRFGLPPDDAALQRLAAALQARVQGSSTGRPSCSAR